MSSTSSTADPAMPTPSNITELSRNSSAKRKRSGKSTAELPTLFSGRLIYSCGESDSSNSTSDSGEVPDIPQLDGTGSSIEIVMAATATAPSTSTSPSPSTSSTWTFLSHPSLRLLPKWPGLYSSSSSSSSSSSLTHLSTPPYRSSNPKVISSLPTPPHTTSPQHPPLHLLSLLSHPPLASSLASHLYGHDLLNLRLLSTSFSSLLSATTSQNSARSYFHSLLQKSLLCPRADTVSDPPGVACSSKGGNVGPCISCSRIICPTCVAPEIWTTRRYRYICPSTTCSSPAPDEPNEYCTCQRNLWICRPCHVGRWLEDIKYSSGGWITISGATCSLCDTKHKNTTDPRLPIISTKGRVGGGGFKRWMMPRDAGTIRPAPRSRKGKHHKVEVVKDEESIKERMRPVSCGWCKKRIDPEKEDWGLRPEKIRIGEERGRKWVEELEEKRRREREAEEAREATEAVLGRGIMASRLGSAGTGGSSSGGSTAP